MVNGLAVCVTDMLEGEWEEWTGLLEKVYGHIAPRQIIVKT